MNTSEIKTEEDDIFNQPKLSTGLNVLTILTFIGCFIQFIFSLLAYFGAKTNYENRDDMAAKMSSPKIPAWLQKLIPSHDDFIKMATKSYFNKVPILIITLLGIVLCFLGALQMKELKKQGYTFYIVGELLPFLSTVIFVGTFALSGIGFYFIAAMSILFILLYTAQRKNLAY